MTSHRSRERRPAPRWMAVALALAVTAPAALAEGPRPLSLAAAVDEALASRPALRAAAAGQAVADARIAEARSGRYPRVVAGERLTNGNNPVLVFGTLLEQGRFGPNNFQVDALNAPDPTTNFRSQLDLQVPLFDQRQTATRIERARLGREGADEGRGLAEQLVRFEVVRAYYEVLVAAAARDVAAEAVASSEADAKRARDRADEGLLVESDVLAVDVQLAEFRQQQIRAGGDLAVAFAALNAALGAPPEVARELAGEPPRASFAPPPLEELVRTALARRPDLRALEIGLRSRDEAVRGARGEYLPRVDAFASVGHSAEKLAGGSGDYTAGVSVTYTLFDAGRKARVDLALAERMAAAAERDERANQVRLEVVRAYHDFVAASERLKVTERAIDQAVETHRIVRNRYEAGITTVTEVLRSQTALVRARLNDLDARYGYTVGYAGLLLATGELVDVAPLTQGGRS